jgi:hypothetical protein
MASRRDDRLTAFIEDDVMQTVGVISTVGDHLGRYEPRDEAAGGCHVVLLARPDCEADRQAERVYDSVQLGAEAATRAAESLGLRLPFFAALQRPGPAPG